VLQNNYAVSYPRENNGRKNQNDCGSYLVRVPWDTSGSMSSTGNQMSEAPGHDEPRHPALIEGRGRLRLRGLLL